MCLRHETNGCFSYAKKTSSKMRKRLVDADVFGKWIFRTAQ